MLQRLSKNFQSQGCLQIRKSTIERVFGVLWNSAKDVLQIKVVQKSFQATKCGISSYISSIFDPLGLLTPVLLRPKLIIQDLWWLKLDWDTPIPCKLENLWLLWRENVNEFSKIKIPRWHGFCHETPKELHIFADATIVAYWAVAYFTFRDQNDQIKGSLIMKNQDCHHLKRNHLQFPGWNFKQPLLPPIWKLKLQRIVKFNQTISIYGRILKLCWILSKN